MLITVVTFVFRVKRDRVRAWLYCIAVFKLMSDLLLYDFSKWALLHGINPLECEKGSRCLTVLLSELGTSSLLKLQMCIQFFVYRDYSFTLADIFMFACGSKWINACLICIMLCSLCRLVQFFVDRVFEHKKLLALMESMVPIRRSILHQELYEKLNKHRVSVCQVESVQSPFSFRRPKACIVFPRGLVQKLSQDEYEAVLSHELQHIRCRDALLMQWLKGICVFFWWIPTALIMKRIQLYLELCCDRTSLSFGITSESMANALIKTARYTRLTQGMAVAFLAGDGNVLGRVKCILKRGGWKDEMRPFVYVMSVLFAGILAMARLWIF